MSSKRSPAARPAPSSSGVQVNKSPAPARGRSAVAASPAPSAESAAAGQAEGRPNGASPERTVRVPASPQALPRGAPPSPVTDPTSRVVRYAATTHVRLVWELPVAVKNPKGCTIAYRFTTTPGDISFGLSFRDASGTESTLKELDRVPSHIGAANGTIHPACSGVVYFRWDNSYSWLTAKELTYLVEVSNVEVPQQPVQPDVMMRTPMAPRQQSRQQALPASQPPSPPQQQQQQQRSVDSRGAQTLPPEDANAAALTAAANAATAAANAAASVAQAEASRLRADVDSLTQQLTAVRLEAAKDREELLYLREQTLLKAPRDEGVADQLTETLQENARLQVDLEQARTAKQSAVQDLARAVHERSRADRELEQTRQAALALQEQVSSLAAAMELQRTRDSTEVLTLRATIEGLTSRGDQLASELKALRSAPPAVRFPSPTRAPPAAAAATAAPAQQPQTRALSPHLEHPIAPSLPKLPGLETVVNVQILDPHKPVDLDAAKQQLQAEDFAGTGDDRGEGGFSGDGSAAANAPVGGSGMHPLLVVPSAMVYGFTLGVVNPWGGSPNVASETDSGGPAGMGAGAGAGAGAVEPPPSPARLAEIAARNAELQRQELEVLKVSKPPRPDGARDPAASGPPRSILKSPKAPHLNKSEEPRETRRGSRESPGGLFGLLGAST